MNIREIQKLIKEERKEKNITLESLSSKLKAPKIVIRSVETDEEFVEKNKPYSIYLLKAICKELKINIDDKIKEVEVDNKENPEILYTKKSNFFENVKVKIINIFKLSILSFILFPVLMYFYYLNELYSKNNENQILSFTYEIPKYSKNQEKINNGIENINKILIITKQNTWMSATIDGKDKVFNISKNKKLSINFENKIHFITIGNANNIIIYYKGKKITFKNEKVIHNIFVDKNGIFKNGYNLAGKSS